MDYWQWLCCLTSFTSFLLVQNQLSIGPPARPSLTHLNQHFHRVCALNTPENSLSEKLVCHNRFVSIRLPRLIMRCYPSRGHFKTEGSLTWESLKWLWLWLWFCLCVYARHCIKFRHYPVRNGSRSPLKDLQLPTELQRRAELDLSAASQSIVHWERCRRETSSCINESSQAGS